MINIEDLFLLIGKGLGLISYLVFPSLIIICLCKMVIVWFSNESVFDKISIFGDSIYRLSLSILGIRIFFDFLNIMQKSDYGHTVFDHEQITWNTTIAAAFPSLIFAFVCVFIVMIPFFIFKYVKIPSIIYGLFLFLCVTGVIIIK